MVKFQFLKFQIPIERSDFKKSKIYPEASGLKYKIGMQIDMGILEIKLGKEII